MRWTKAIIDSNSVIYSDGIVAFIMKKVPNMEFMIGETPVTQALWMAIEGSNPSEGIANPYHPVSNVNYPMAKAFLEHLNEVTGESFRLPKADEWEMAAMCGDRNYPFQYAGTDDFDSIDTRRQSVKGAKPNEIGLYCMTGNILEWTETIIRTPADKFASEGLSMLLRNISADESVEERILKGGSSAQGRHTSQIKHNKHYPSSYRNGLTGLRLIIDKTC